MSAATVETPPLCIRLATPLDRQRIYRMRHDVYAQELGQHACNAEGELRDALDAFNEYIVVAHGDELCGFVSITPPGQKLFSLDKYLPRERWPFSMDAGLYEMRLLTVPDRFRSGPYAALLMHASRRYLQTQKATRVVAIGRREVLHLYEKIGFQRLGHVFQSGAVQYELMACVLDEIAPQLTKFEPLLRRWQPSVHWELDVPFLPASLSEQNGHADPAASQSTAACYHGGAFFESIGTGFDTLERRHEIINADVLDAWFPPAPSVLEALHNHLDWIVRTSPPTQCEGLVNAIAESRGVPTECIAPGAGSSDLIFRSMLRWLQPGSRVLLLDPTYGEYRHVFQRVVPCEVDCVATSSDEGFRCDLDRLAAALRRRYDLVVLVNPNNPTGMHMARADLELVVKSAPAETRIWIDEAYLDYVSSGASLERFAADSRNVVVCKSMSKAYALSGLRVGYVCGPREWMSDLRAITPPWSVGLPAQIAAVNALRAGEYYQTRYDQTRRLCSALAADLETAGLTVWRGAANFLLCRLPLHCRSLPDFLTRCRERGLFLRDVASMTSRPDSHSGLFRIAVKDAETNRRMVQIIHNEAL